MLYLFGRLALSDALSYHESYADDDYPKRVVAAAHLDEPELDARAATISRRLRRSRHLPQNGRPSAGCLNC
jgi:uncharacterized membrane protein